MNIMKTLAAIYQGQPPSDLVLPQGTPTQILTLATKLLSVRRRLKLPVLATGPRQAMSALGEIPAQQMLAMFVTLIAMCPELISDSEVTQQFLQSLINKDLLLTSIIDQADLLTSRATDGRLLCMNQTASGNQLAAGAAQAAQGNPAVGPDEQRRLLSTLRAIEKAQAEFQRKQKARDLAHKSKKAKLQEQLTQTQLADQKRQAQERLLAARDSKKKGS